MGQITVDNQHDADYWKKLLTCISGKTPTIEGVREYHVTLSSKEIDQAALDSLVAIWQRNKRRGEPMEVANCPPSTEEREAATKLSIHERALINQGRADESK